MHYKITCNLSFKNELGIDPVILLLGIYPKRKNSKNENPPFSPKVLIAIMFIIRTSWKQSKIEPWGFLLFFYLQSLYSNWMER